LVKAGKGQIADLIMIRAKWKGKRKNKNNFINQNCSAGKGLEGRKGHLAHLYPLKGKPQPKPGEVLRHTPRFLALLCLTRSALAVLPSGVSRSQQREQKGS
jgi:hypothetical protein